MLIAEKKDVDQIVFISDVHFGVRGGKLEWLDNIVDYFDNFFIPFLSEASKAHRICVVVAGDYFDNRNNIDINVMNTAIKVMERIVKVCDVIMMVGNHDIYKSSSTDTTSLYPLTLIPGVTVVYDKMELVIDDNKKILLVSWIGDFKEENKVILENKDKYDLLVFHTEISGMSYDNGRSIINGLNIDIVDDNKIVSGHIHKRQESSKGIYLGSPYHMKRDDVGNKKGIYTFTVQDGKLVRLFTENSYSPEYVRCRFSDIGRNPDDWKYIVRNNYVTIIFTDEELDVVNVSKFVNELQVYKPKDISLVEERTKVVNVQPNEQDGDEQPGPIITPDSNIEEIFDIKLKSINLKTKELSEIRKLNKDYLKKANEEFA